jgi:hypothetical protein
MAARHREAAARTEVVLDVDHQKHIALADGRIFFQTDTLSPRKQGRFSIHGAFVLV